MKALARVSMVIGLVILCIVLLVAVVRAYSAFTTPMPLKCLQHGGSFNTLPAECQGPNIALTVGPIVLVGLGIGALWRTLNQ